MKVNIGDYPKKGSTRVVKIKIDEYDLFSLDATLALIILPALKKFKNTSFCHPTNLTKKKWEKILDKMIASFSSYEKDDINPSEQLERQEGFELFGKYFTNLWY